MYQLAANQTVLRLADQVWIPANPANADYQAYQHWLAAGNTPEPADPEPMEPNYKGFRMGLMQLTSWKTWSAEALKVDQISLLDFRDLALNNLWDEAQVIYNNLKAASIPPIASIKQWQAIADQYHVPFQF